jgi:thioredoxin-related protein
MNRIVFTLIISLLSLGSMRAQETIKWHTIEEADALLKTDPKPVFIDLYTDWCSWCKRLSKDTFTDPVIIAYLNKNFIPVKFNAESKETVSFLGNEYKNDGTYGKTHELALALTQGKPSYPTLVFFNKKGEFLGPVPGYKKPADLEPYLVFLGEEKYLAEKWEEFIENFQGSF